MRSKTIEGSVEVETTRTGVIISSYRKSGELDQFIALTRDEAVIVYTMLKTALHSG